MSTNEDYTGLEIAIIGMAGRFPGAKDIPEFWENLKKGVESITYYPEAELLEDGLDIDLMETPGYIRCGGGIIENKEFFDAPFFGYSAAEAELMDPQVRVFHECAWHALEDAGYNPFSYKGLIGLFAGASFNLLWEAVSFASGRINDLGYFTFELLIDRDYLCTRVSYNLNLKGPSVIVKSACSTSLVAIHMASQSILNGECDMALAGGVTLKRITKTGYMYHEDMVVSKDGHCRAFDAEATGSVFGDGVGAVLLKRLEDAISDNDHIYAIIKGSAVNNDGTRRVGYTAPSIVGQTEVIADALQVANVDPETITYVETHGTGTAVGDPIEIEGLKTAFATEKKGYCRIGSVKSNVGHLDSAAGVTGLIKTALALKHKIIPTSLHYESPNPKIDFANSPFLVNTALTPWQHNGHPLRAGVSSFGIGGTNAHVILEEAPQNSETKVSRPYQLITFSAKTETALEQMTKNLKEHFEKNPNLHPADAAYTLHLGRKTFPHRRMLVCSQLDEAVQALTSPETGKIRSGYSKEDNKSIIFMYSGLGSQYADMGLGLYKNEPIFRREADRCFELLNPLLEYDIKRILYPSIQTGTSGQASSTDNTNQSSHINNFEVAQVAIFILEYTLSRLLMDWGIKPHALIGYSFGEYTAACLSGVFSLEDALKLIVARGKLIASTSNGSMLSVPLPMEQVKPLLEEDISIKDRLSIAIDNGASCIVAGPDDLVDKFEKHLKAKRYLGMKVPHSHAIHSAMMDPLLEQFTQNLGRVNFNRPQIPYISNLTGKWIAVEEATDPGYWARHMRETVRFADGIEELKKEPNPLFIEIGPGRDLCALLVRHKEETENPGPAAINLIRPQQQKGPDQRYLLNKIGQIWLNGGTIHWQKLYHKEQRQRIPLPLYPFDRYQFWFKGNPLRDGNMFRPPIPPRKIDVADWFYIPQWNRSTLPANWQDNISSYQGCWLLFTGKDALGPQLIKKLKNLKQKVITVEPGCTFAGNKTGKYTINPSKSEDYNQLFKALAESDTIPGQILHLWGLTGNGKTGTQSVLEELDRLQDLTLYSLLNIAQAIGNNSINSEIRIGTVTDNMQPVTGEETLYPAKATLLGPIKIIPLEYSNIKCLSIDIMNPGNNKQKKDFIIENILGEFSGEINDYRVVAYRGTYRWKESYESVRLENPSTPTKKPVLKESGVYLVTGGFGGMGFFVAQHLVKTVKARLILVDILETALKEGQDQWLISDERKQDIQAKKETIEQWKKEGIEVQVYDADVSDYNRMKQVITEIREQFGTIDGVIHTAGLIDYSGVIQRRTRQMTDSLLDAKVKGTLVLDELLADRPPEFTILFSSIGNLFHKLKFGQVGYNAGHEFLDIFSYSKRQMGQHVVSVDWNDWKEVGMAVRAEQERNTAAPTDGNQDILSITPSQGIDAFNRILEASYPRFIVFARDLNQVLEFMNKTLSEEGSIVDAFGQRESSGAQHQRPQLDSEYIAPVSEIQKALAQIWQKLFGIDRVGIEDDFFELGGDSLLAISMAGRINQQMNTRIPLAEIYNRPTIKKLVEYMEKKSDTFKGVDERMVLFSEGTEQAENFFFVHTGYDEVDVYYELCSRMNSDFTYWGIQADSITDYAPQNLTFKEIAVNNIKKIQSVQPHGPYCIAGWCLGGKFAFEIARQLELMGEEVKLFVSIDSPAQQTYKEFTPPFTVESEINMLMRGIPGSDFDKRAAGITELKKLWPAIIDYLEETDFDINIIRELVHPSMRQAFPNFNELTIKELIFYLNTSRTYLRAETNFRPKGKLKGLTFSFEAINSDVKTYAKQWKEYCDNLRIYDIPGDHFSIFRVPDVEKFAEIFDKALENDLLSTTS